MNIKLPNLNLFKNLIIHTSDFFKKKPAIVLGILLLAVVLASSAIFYFFVIQAPDLNNDQQIIKIDKTLYQEVINRLDSREANIQQGIGQSCPDVFR